MVTLHKIRQAEPEVSIIVGGDFNQPLHDTKNRTRTNIEKCNMKVCHYEEESFHRSNEDGTTKSSRIDYFAVTKELNMKTRVITRTMSDHNAIMTEIRGRDDNLTTPRRKCNKEMFFSNLLNEIKEKHIRFYMRYAMQLVSLVMNENQELNTVKHQEILEELKCRIPIVEVN